MGHHHAKAAAKNKGPFSDEEYEVLAKLLCPLLKGEDGSKLFKNEMLRRVSEIYSLSEIGRNVLGEFFKRWFGYLVKEDGDWIDRVALLVRASSKRTVKCLLELDMDVIRLIYCMINPEREMDLESVVCDGEVDAGYVHYHFPLLQTVVQGFLTKCLFGKGNGSYRRPNVVGGNSVLKMEQVYMLSMSNGHLQNDWCRLYTSAENGLSFNRYCHHVLGYDGPSIVVCMDTLGCVFGMYCDTGWQEQKSFYGSDGCFLFQVQPKCSIYRATLSGPKNRMYLNTKGVALPRGFGMGGNTNSIRLFFNEDFDECTCSASCPSFDSGRVASSKQFSISVLEVWGCGDQNALQSQTTYRKDTQQLINKARKVDKAQFAGNDFDKEFLLGKTFATGANQARVADDES